MTWLSFSLPHDLFSFLSTRAVCISLFFLSSPLLTSRALLPLLFFSLEHIISTLAESPQDSFTTYLPLSLFFCFSYSRILLHSFATLHLLIHTLSSYFPEYPFPSFNDIPFSLYLSRSFSPLSLLITSTFSRVLLISHQRFYSPA